MNQEKYTKLREQLMESMNYPSIYMFKFVIPNTDEKLQSVKKLFPADTKFAFKTSRDLKYIGITVKKMMNSADEIIDIYTIANRIEGAVIL
jgi:type II secretory pathway component PulF